MVALYCKYCWHLIFVGGAIFCLRRQVYTLCTWAAWSNWNRAPMHIQSHIYETNPWGDVLMMRNHFPSLQTFSVIIFNFQFLSLHVSSWWCVCAATKEWSTTFQQESKIINRIENRNKCSILFGRRTLISLGQNCRMFFLFILRSE